jgi:HD-GYP domain-containing protein (c-di-GMP phosphodiesterase class II)/CheY-like chemotaxis protein
MAYRALVVHTQPEALGELVELLGTGAQLVVDTARSATEFLHKVQAAGADYAVILADHRPPELNAIELVDKSAAFLPDAMRIVTASDAGLLDVKAPVTAEGVTVFRFVGRPSDRGQLVGLVSQGLKLHRMEREQRELIKKLHGEHLKLQKREKLLDVVVRERTKELEESYLKLKAANRQALLGLAEAIEAKDAYTKGHCGRVAAYAMALAAESHFPAEQMESLEFASFLHDIGKIGVRDSVLLKPGPLDEEEWTHMRRHPAKGYEMLEGIDMLKPTLPAIRNHHERWDGKGYPDGLTAEEIPMSARLVAIADAYDAMATERPYKKALPLGECETLLRRNAGSMFDPALVEIFVTQHLGSLYRDDDGGEAPRTPPRGMSVPLINADATTQPGPVPEDDIQIDEEAAADADEQPAIEAATRA